MVIAFILLAIVFYLFCAFLLAVWEYKNEQKRKRDWQDYWDKIEDRHHNQ